jgi:DNA polymerase-3 subunit alpha (Gram-positive type)
LEKNGIIRDIDLKIHDEVNKKAQFRLINKNDDIDSKEEFLKGTLNEEKILSKAMIENQNKVSNNKTKEKRKSSSYTLGKKIEEEPIDISEINSNISHAVVKGEIFNVGKREIKGGKKLYIFNITDYTNSITVKSFVASKKEEEMDLYIKKEHMER